MMARILDEERCGVKEYRNAETATCEPCHDECRQCFGPNKYECEQCSEPFKICKMDNGSYCKSHYMVKTPPQPTSSLTIDTAALVAALQAYAQNGQTVPQQIAPSIPLSCSHFTDAEKVTYDVRALDSSTFNKVARGLLAVTADIETLTDFGELNSFLLSLEPTFALAYFSLSHISFEL
uniref:Uncharacterized protein n=1 Tax=Panagrolaimus superbus TaxID=310955 RepID=A0A914Y2S7_9BILA